MGEIHVCVTFSFISVHRRPLSLQIEMFLLLYTIFGIGIEILKPAGFFFLFIEICLGLDFPNFISHPTLVLVSASVLLCFALCIG